MAKLKWLSQFIFQVFDTTYTEYKTKNHKLPINLYKYFLIRKINATYFENQRV